jgi:hypothetical protein
MILKHCDAGWKGNQRSFKLVDNRDDFARRERISVLESESEKFIQ